MTGKAWLVMADGTRFEGQPMGAKGTAVGEAVFQTGMTGYQEVLTDPSYCGQVVVMTAPQIGNTGINHQDHEARRPSLSGFVCRELSPVVSNWRSEIELEQYLRQNGIVGLTNVDTRAITRHIRDRGAQMAAIGTGDPKSLHEQAKAAPPMQGRNLVAEVTTSEPFEWTEGSGDWRTCAPRTGETMHVVAIDYGVKHNILRCLVDVGARLTVVPASTRAEDILALEPDGVFLSNGPGDPAAVTGAADTVRALLDKKPVFGICLGHQILALALGGSTYKLKFGHHGLNQPVRDVETGRIEVTSQNHGFAVDVASLEGKCEMTHVNLNDETCEGIAHTESGAFGVQYHPEASAGPHDARYLFERFAERIEQAR